MQSNDPKLVTIALPIYRRLEYLPQVLGIVAAQDYPNIELLVSDNGMNGTRVHEIIEAFYPRPYRFRQNSATVNISKHFNQLICETMSEYFVILCDDDEISSNYVSELVASLETNPDASVAIARQEMLDANGVVVRKSSATMPPVVSGEDFISATWNDYAYGMEMVGTYLARTKILRACGGYPDFCRGTGIDNALLLKLVLGRSVGLNSRCTFRWRLDDASFGWSVSSAELALASREFLNFLDTDPKVAEYALAHPEQWRQIKDSLVKMTWQTYLGRWNDIYRQRLSWLPWVKSAFAMPFISDYYKMIARQLYADAKSLVKKRIHMEVTTL
jgi:glycosyltransferase involved in cell wall biosynthesis